MKKIFVSSLLAALSIGAQAEGYIGASVGRGKMSLNCAEGASCRQSVNIFKLYAGTRLNESHRINIGAARIDALEVAYMRSNGGVSETSMVDQQYLGEDPDFGGPAVLVRTVPARRLVSLDALVLAPVLTVEVAPHIDAFAKAGFALVTGTVESTLNGVSYGGHSSTRLKPYIGFGASATVVPNRVKLLGSFDWLKYGTGEVSGAVRTINFGTEVSF